MLGSLICNLLIYTFQVDATSDQESNKASALSGSEHLITESSSASSSPMVCDNPSPSSSAEVNQSTVTPGSVATVTNTIGTLEKKRVQRPMPIAAPRTTLLHKVENQGEYAINKAFS